MNYLDYNKIGSEVIESGNVDAICYFFSTASPIINSRIKSFKYTHSDLTKKEHKQLMKLNNLNDDDILIGGEVHRVVGDVETKKLVLKKVDEIELFTILHQINWIFNERIKNKINGFA